MLQQKEFNSNLYHNNYKPLFINLLRFNKRSIINIIYLLKVVYYQRQALRLRAKNRIKGIDVPPLIFFSITRNCNLNCKGCYQKAQNRSEYKELSTEKIISILKEAFELGSSLVGILGGEPFLREDLFTITSSQKRMLFAVFTNGMLIDDAMIKKLKKNKNIIPIVSNEGYECQTDGRRGNGVFHQFKEITEKFKKNHIIFGVSFTVTRENFDIVTNDTYLRDLIKTGCSLFFFVDYKPVDGISNELMLTQAQLKILEDFTYTFRETYKTLYFSPLAEKQFGGCIGAGKGLIHINYDGSVEPCPFAPISDTNLQQVSFKEALNSEILRIIRNNHAVLEHSHHGGCTLWEHRHWLEKIKNNENVSQTV